MYFRTLNKGESMKLHYLPVLVCLALQCAVQQISAQDIVDFERFRVLLNTGERFEATDGILSADSLTAVKKGSDKFSIPLSEIRAMDRFKGTRATAGLMIGAGTGLLIVLFAIIQVEADPNRELREERVAPVLIGFTAAGGLIGWAVGSAMKKWERVPPGTYRTSIEFNGPRVMFTWRF